MKLYHSSNTVIEHPDTQHSRKYLDFGRGFYLTSLYDQAVRYAQRFKRRGQTAWLNIYELSDIAENQWNIKKFESYNKEWLDFVAQCRDGKDIGDFDMIIGGIANDKVIMTLDRYFIKESRILYPIQIEIIASVLRPDEPNLPIQIDNQLRNYR